MPALTIFCHPLVRQALEEASHTSVSRALKLMLWNGAWETAEIGCPVSALPPVTPWPATAIIGVPQDIKRVWQRRWGFHWPRLMSRVVLHRLYVTRPDLVARVYEQADMSRNFNVCRLERFRKYQQRQANEHR